MSNIKDYLKEEEAFVVGALDSLGVPYTIDNKDLKSFIELTVNLLTERGVNLKYINLCSLGRNKTWELEEIIKKDYSIEKYIKQNKVASEFVITGKRKDEEWNFPTNPNFLDTYYKIPAYSNLHITTMLKESKHPIFLYSCGGMNIRSYLKIKTEMNPTVALDITKEVLLRARKHIIQTKRDVDSVLSLIENLNPNIEIYVLGVYAMLDNAVLRDFASPFVFWYNAQLKQVLESHNNVHYVDIAAVKGMVAEGDMHPTFEGQKYIAGKIMNKMEEEYQKKLSLTRK